MYALTLGDSHSKPFTAIPYGGGTILLELGVEWRHYLNLFVEHAFLCLVQLASIHWANWDIRKRRDFKS